MTTPDNFPTVPTPSTPDTRATLATLGETPTLTQPLALSIPCPECYGGHFRPCQVCGDLGWLDLTPHSTPFDPTQITA